MLCECVLCVVSANWKLHIRGYSIEQCLYTNSKYSEEIVTGKTIDVKLSVPFGYHILVRTLERQKRVVDGMIFLLICYIHCCCMGAFSPIFKAIEVGGTFA